MHEFRRLALILTYIINIDKRIERRMLETTFLLSNISEKKRLKVKSLKVKKLPLFLLCMYVFLRMYVCVCVFVCLLVVYRRHRLT